MSTNPGMNSLPDLPPEARQSLNKWLNESGEQRVQEVQAAPQEQPQEGVAEQPVEEIEAAPEQAAQENIAQERSSELDRNLRAMRNEMKRLKQENERLQQETRPAQQTAQPEEDDVRSDDIVEGKHLKKYQQKLRDLEQKFETANIEIRLKSNFPDFDRVVTESAIEQLKDEHPELYQTLYSSNDLYNKAASAYTLIKKLGMGMPTEAQRDKQVAIKNSAKPKSLASISPQSGSSPLSQANAFANGLTPDLQKQLLKEMAEARKGM